MNTISIKIVFFLSFFFPASCFSQDFTQPDSAEAKIWKSDCDDKVFMKVEIAPFIKGGMKVLEDSLSGYLRSENIFQNNMHAKFRFTISSSSQVLGISIMENTFQKPELIEKFLRSHGYMWRAALQNGRYVCAMIHFQIEITDDKLTSNTRW